jgi:DNA-binding XRE family transcriptional regulator
MRFSTPQGHKIDLHLPQETLARLIGSTRQRVNQILKDWEPRDIVKHEYGRIFLLDQAVQIVPSGRCPLYPGGLNRSTRHFNLKGKRWWRWISQRVYCCREDGVMGPLAASLKAIGRAFGKPSSCA